MGPWREGDRYAWARYADATRPHARLNAHVERRGSSSAEAIGRFDAFELDTVRVALECVDIKTGELTASTCSVDWGVAKSIESLGVGECVERSRYLATGNRG